MRSILFFDLPTTTSLDTKNYRKFLKEIKKMGFYMLQESVYVKLSIDYQAVESTIIKIKSIAPSRGSIIILNVTEKQYLKMQFITGEYKSDIISNDKRIIIL